MRKAISRQVSISEIRLIPARERGKTGGDLSQRTVDLMEGAKKSMHSYAGGAVVRLSFYNINVDFRVIGHVFHRGTE